MSITGTTGYISAVISQERTYEILIDFENIQGYFLKYIHFLITPLHSYFIVFALLDDTKYFAIEDFTRLGSIRLACCELLLGIIYIF